MSRNREAAVYIYEGVSCTKRSMHDCVSEFLFLFFRLIGRGIVKNFFLFLGCASFSGLIRGQILELCVCVLR